jgi:hypothetical protein
MTGPEHYREAERLLAGLDDIRDVMTRKAKGDADLVACAITVNGYVAEIQVHATLALAAATAELDGYGEGGAVTGRPVISRVAWDEVIS